MVLGVMSDTHGNQRLMHEVADCLVQQLGAQLLFHLGDDYQDAETLPLSGLPVRKVPGLWCPEYHDPRISNRLVENIAGLTVVAVHADKDLRPSDYGADVVLTGHTHTPRIELVGPLLHVNPGHLKPRADRGERPTFATIAITSDKVHARIHECGGRIRNEVTLLRTQLA